MVEERVWEEPGLRPRVPELRGKPRIAVGSGLTQKLLVP